MDCPKIGRQFPQLVLGSAISNYLELIAVEANNKVADEENLKESNSAPKSAGIEFSQTIESIEPDIRSTILGDRLGDYIKDGLSPRSRRCLKQVDHECKRRVVCRARWLDIR